MEGQNKNKKNCFYYYELYTHLKDRSKEDRDSFFLTDERIKIIQIFPWGFVDHDNDIVKHIAWKEIKKNIEYRKKWKLI